MESDLRGAKTLLRAGRRQIVEVSVTLVRRSAVRYLDFERARRWFFGDFRGSCLLTVYTRSPAVKSENQKSGTQKVTRTRCSVDLLPERAVSQLSMERGIRVPRTALKRSMDPEAEIDQVYEFFCQLHTEPTGTGRRCSSRPGRTSRGERKNPQPSWWELLSLTRHQPRSQCWRQLLC